MVKFLQVLFLVCVVAKFTTSTILDNERSGLMQLLFKLSENNENQVDHLQPLKNHPLLSKNF